MEVVYDVVEYFLRERLSLHMLCGHDGSLTELLWFYKTPMWSRSFGLWGIGAGEKCSLGIIRNCYWFGYPAQWPRVGRRCHILPEQIEMLSNGSRELYQIISRASDLCFPTSMEVSRFLVLTHRH